MTRKPASTDLEDKSGAPLAEAPRNATFMSSDGLRLFARDYGSTVSPWLPVVCLAGLSRNSRDFHELAVHLSTHRDRPRRVVAFDYRGRGQSEWDKSPERYNPLTEMNDVFDGMAALGIPRAVVIGTSRGGIIGMLMGVARPATVAALVLNDIGPVIEAHGLARIKTYVGRTPQPNDWTDAAHLMRRLHAGSFTAWGDTDWESFARLTYRDEGTGPGPDYDPKLAMTLEGVELDQPMPTLWDEFRSLAAIPILTIRGENSDLLSAETLARMQEIRPDMGIMEIAGEGHAPLLRQAEHLARISAFIAAAEGAGPPANSVMPRDEASYDLDAPAETAQAIEAG